MLSISSTCWQQPHPATSSVEAFGIRNWVSRRVLQISKGSSSERLFLADQNKNMGNSWSKSANGRSSSPLQVRKRVKAVLEKARTRTGVDNASTQQPKPSNVVAEAASLGGLDEDYVIQLKSFTFNGENGVANNGKANGSRRTFPDEDWEIQRANGTDANGANGNPRKPKDFDVIRGDVPAANQFSEPLPFQLPKLSKEQIRQLEAGERVQEQERMGREGSGYVVVDVKAPPYVIWECLLDFESYPEIIPTVRDMQLYTSEKLNTGFVDEKPVLPGTERLTRHYGTPSVTRASFVLSKFRLNIAAVHKYSPHPEGDYMVFNLDKSCTNMVLKGAKGIWHTVENPDGREVRLCLKPWGKCSERVWPQKGARTQLLLFVHLDMSCLVLCRVTLVSTCYVKFKFQERCRRSLSIMPPIMPCLE